MIVDGRCLALPLVSYLNTQANVEALIDVEEGMTAYASDLDALGARSDMGWSWISMTAGAVYTMPPATVDIPGGTGTPAYLAKWTDANTLGDSLFKDDGVSAALGVTTTLEGYAKLRVGDNFTSDGSSNCAWMQHFYGALTGAAGDTSKLIGSVFANTIVTQTAAEDVALMAQVYILEPGITKNVTNIPVAATLYVDGAPTEGISNYALCVSSGTSYFGGAVNAGVSLAVASGTAYVGISDNPGANARILASDASGYLQLVRLGIGVSPTVPLELLGSSTTLYTYWSEYSTTAVTCPTLALNRSNNNTPGTKTTTTTGQYIGIIEFRGVPTAPIFAAGADIRVYQDGAVGADWVPMTVQLRLVDTTGVTRTPMLIQSSGVFQVGVAPTGFDLSVIGTTTSVNYVSTVAIGTAPYACTSETLNTHLNADFLDGYHATSFLLAGSGLTTQVAYWTGAPPATLAGDNGFIYDAANDLLTLSGPSATRIIAQSADAATATATFPLRLDHITSGAAGVGFGVGAEAYLEDSSGADQLAGSMALRWSMAATATRRARIELRANYIGTSVLCGVIVAPTTASVDGNNRGIGAVDLQGDRTLASQVASGTGSVIIGGSYNVASGVYSFAAGCAANAVHNGAFVWADSVTSAAFSSTSANQFAIRTHSGAWFCATDLAATSGIINMLTLEGRVTGAGVGAVGDGVGILFKFETATPSTVQNMARVGAAWGDPAVATATSYLTFQLVSAGGALAEYMRLTPVSLILNAGSVIVDSNTYGLQLGAHQDVMVSSNGPGAFILTPDVDTDIIMTFTGTTHSGEFKWMEDEDYFQFGDDILLQTSEKLYLRDTAIGIYSQADTYLDLFADGAVRIGNSAAGAPTNYARFGPNGDLSFVGTAGFYPVRIAQATQPAPDTGELVVWRDTDDGKIYLVYNDADSGVKQCEMV